MAPVRKKKVVKDKELSLKSKVIKKMKYGRSLLLSRKGLQDGALTLCPEARQKYWKERTCPTCQHYFRDRLHMLKHFESGKCKTAVAKGLQCKNCFDTFITSNGLDIHIEKIDCEALVKTRKFIPQCIKCGKICPTISDAVKHVARCKGKPEMEPKRYQCPTCKKTFTNNRMHKAHIAKQTCIEMTEEEQEEQPKTELYRCYTCGNRYASPYHFQFHKTQHCDDPEFDPHAKKRVEEDDCSDDELLEKKKLNPKLNCQICEASFDSAADLLKHKRTSKCRNICWKCGEKFQTYEAAKEHRKESKCSVPTCELCEKTLSSYVNYRNHVRDKTCQPAVCDLCGDLFPTKTGMLRHRANCMKRKCEECNLTFATPVAQRSHLVAVHGRTELLHCSKCGVKRSSPETVLVHFRHHHNFNHERQVPLEGPPPVPETYKQTTCKICCRKVCAKQYKRHCKSAHHQNMLQLRNKSKQKKTVEDPPIKKVATYKCVMCSSEFLKYNSLQCHLLRCHRKALMAKNVEALLPSIKDLPQFKDISAKDEARTKPGRVTGDFGKMCRLVAKILHDEEVAELKKTEVGNEEAMIEPEPVPIVKKKSKKAKKPKFQCPVVICRCKLDSMEDMETHVSQMHGRTIPARSFGLLVARLASVKARKTDPRDPSNVCYVCKKAFVDPLVLKHHEYWCELKFGYTVQKPLPVRRSVIPRV